MSKAVLMSIKPKYCEMIIRGEKAIEVRKRAPKLKPPFKVYMYCTLDPKDNLCIRTNKGDLTLNGFVIGEFECDEVFEIKVFDNKSIRNWNFYNLPAACIPYDELAAYIGPNKTGYGLHISRLRLYTKPKGLSRFIRPCPHSLYCESCATFPENRGRCFNAALQIIRPPQSWMYVEEWYFNE